MSRGKRLEIVASATERFGSDGYEDTKWADVAADVGIGTTALYYYFESKLHCLYEILAEALAAEGKKFERVTGEHEGFVEALEAAVAAIFELSDREVLRNRVFVAEQGLLRLRRTAPREEEARQQALSRVREIERGWAAFLAGGMALGAIPNADANLLSRALLGTANSVWHWYHPEGDLALAEVRDFYVGRCLAIAGVAAGAGSIDRG